MKYYFINTYDENCTSKEGVIDYMKILGLSELEVNEAERLYGMFDQLGDLYCRLL